jgi:hypothetical protein
MCSSRHLSEACVSAKNLCRRLRAQIAMPSQRLEGVGHALTNLETDLDRQCESAKGYDSTREPNSNLSGKQIVSQAEAYWVEIYNGSNLKLVTCLISGKAIHLRSRGKDLVKLAFMCLDACNSTSLELNTIRMDSGQNSIVTSHNKAVECCLVRSN